ncbi:MAG: hypothetical protein U1D06_07465 [Paracoccaceae bacterium]|nr:hypothetical protein [Paracoccaceae bacterium]
MAVILFSLQRAGGKGQVFRAIRQPELVAGVVLGRINRILINWDFCPNVKKIDDFLAK